MRRSLKQNNPTTQVAGVGPIFSLIDDERVVSGHHNPTF